MTDNNPTGYYDAYYALVKESDIVTALQNCRDEALQLFTSLSPGKWFFRYADGKWSVKEVLLHIVDSERIMSYRALCIARGEQQMLPGYDENDYVDNSYSSTRNHEQLLDEFKAVRQASIELFRGLPFDVLEFKGKANNRELSVKQLGLIIAGHQRHHIKVIKERYLL